MENIELGQRRWSVLKTRRFWQKISEMVCAIVAITLCTTFDQTSSVHTFQDKDPYYYYRISFTFPFIYETNVTVESLTPTGLPLKQFKFEKLLPPSAMIFVAVTALSLSFAFTLFILNVIHHGTQKEHGYIKLEFFLSIGSAFVMLAGISLWLANLVTLVQDGHDEMNSLFSLCKDNVKNKCEKKEANFVALYISTGFAILLFLLWLIECIQLFIKMVYTIPTQITLTTLVRNVELGSVGTPDERQVKTTGRVTARSLFE